jgi:glucose dehydrogenase
MDERVTTFSLCWTDTSENPWAAYAYREDEKRFYIGYGRTKLEALDDLVHALAEPA